MSRNTINMHGRDTSRNMHFFVIGAMLSLLFVTPSVSAAQSKKELLKTIAWQAALDRVGISPGLIDGIIGPKTRLATKEFQRVRGLAQTGRLDEQTAESLEINKDRAVARYKVQQSDLEQIGKVPNSWKAKSRMDRLGHANLHWVLAEKFHCTRGLLSRLNPGKNINALKPGDTLIVPYVSDYAPKDRAAVIEISFPEKVIRVIDTQQQLIGLFHCSIAKHKKDLPSGTARITCAVPDPSYTFNPDMWPEVNEDIDQPLTIPPGPRNPVGRFWIGLSKPGYGIHGTPNPELIGKTGSHGCFRLANWDAVRLGKMVHKGTRVRFRKNPRTEVASSQ
jgi:lipoprotein-anchoring transpeptidase ErfK/SrfK